MSPETLAKAENRSADWTRFDAATRETLLTSLGYVCIAAGVTVMAFGGWIMVTARSVQMVS